jgi:hypothetical protein
MALKKTIELEGNTSVDTVHGSINTGTAKVVVAAYIKVHSISGYKNILNVDVSFTDGKDSVSNDKIQFSKRYTVPVSTEANAPNFIKQAYEYLKTLPEFENSEDC